MGLCKSERSHSAEGVGGGNVTFGAAAAVGVGAVSRRQRWWKWRQLSPDAAPLSTKLRGRRLGKGWGWWNWRRLEDLRRLHRVREQLRRAGGVGGGRHAAR